MFAIIGEVVFKTQVAAIPAVADVGGQELLRCTEHGGDIVCLIHDPMMIIAPTRRQNAVAHNGAIDAHFVDAQCTDIQGGAGDCAGGLECMGELGGGGA